MFSGLAGSMAAKILAAVVAGLGLVGGLTAMDALPDLGEAPSVTASLSTPAGDASASTNHAPTGDLFGLPTGSKAAEAFKMIEQARASAAGATAAAHDCLGKANSQLSGLLGLLRSVTTVAQAEDLLSTAGLIGNDARRCAEEAQTLARESIAQAAAAASKANSLGAMPDLGGLGGLTNSQDLLGQILSASDAAGKAAASAEELASTVVSSVVTTAEALLPNSGGALAGPVPGQGGAPLPVPGAADLPIPGLGDLPGLPLPGEGGGLPLPVPGTGESPLPEVATDLVTELANSILGQLGGTLPVPGL